MNKKMNQCLILSVIVAGLVACQHTPTMKSEQLVQQIVRQDQSFQSERSDPKSLADGFLSEQAAVMEAIRHNPAFLVQLADIDLVDADMQTVNQLNNPSLFYAFGTASKSYRYAIELPIEAIFLRPYRIKQAQAQAQLTQYQLMQSGFTLIRDARVAYAQAVITQERVKKLEDALQVNSAMSRLAKARERLGDASAQETLIAENEALLSARDLQSAQVDAKLAYTQLMHMIGRGEVSGNLAFSDVLIPSCSMADLSQLRLAALSSRPDVLAAEAAVSAAEAKVKQEKLNWLSPSVIADATSGQSNGHVLAPAIRVGLPIFHQSQGQRQRAEAERLKAQLEVTNIRQKASLDIQTSVLKYQRDCQDWQQLQTELLPNAAQSIDYATHAYQSGAIAYLNVLESSKRYFSMLLRETQLKADLIASWSDLMRSTNGTEPLLKSK